MEILSVAEVFLDNERFPDCAARLEQDFETLNEALAIYKNIGKIVIRETGVPQNLHEENQTQILRCGQSGTAKRKR
jgi:hypothetical protein